MVSFGQKSSVLIKHQGNKIQIKQEGDKTKSVLGGFMRFAFNDWHFCLCLRIIVKLPIYLLGYKIKSLL